MQNNGNQTNQKDPNDRGLNDSNDIFPELCSIWLAIGDDLRTLLT